MLLLGEFLRLKFGRFNRNSCSLHKLLSLKLTSVRAVLSYIKFR